MTNEEKAKELCNIELPGYLYDRKDYLTGCYNIALAMAKWKDEQFNKILNEKS